MDNFGVLTIKEGEIEEEGIIENLKVLIDRVELATEESRRI